MKNLLLALILLFVTSGARAQVTVFSDDFNTSTGTTYTTAAGPIGSSTTWSFIRSGADWGARIDGNILDLTNDAGGTANAIGWGFGYTPAASFAAPYTTTLSSNVGVVTWTFNMRQIRTDPGGFASGSYGVAFILGGTSSTVETAGNGYAVVLGNIGSTDPIRLIKYTGGLQGPLADIIASNTVGFTDFGAEYMSIKVTYTPSTGAWQLYLRDDNGPPFADPAAGSLTLQGTVVDNTYTGSALSFMGGFWQGSTAANQTAFFDNTTVTVTYPNTITTGAVTTTPFTLANCAATASGNVAFTSTDVYTAGNVFSAQLSDDIGSFAAPITIGSLPLTGTNPGGSIPITIPAGTVSGTGYIIRVVSSNPSIIGTSSSAFTITQSGLCASSHTDYYRSITSGDWGDPTTWESSSDNFTTVISPATLVPTYNANTITVRTGHTVTIATAASADQLTIQSGGVLNHTNGIAFTLNDGTGTDMTILNGGIYVLNGTQPTGSGTVEVQSGGKVRVDANPAPNQSDDFAYGNANVTFRTGSVYEWATTNIPEWSGRIYFTSTESPTYRFSSSPSLPIGGNTITIIYGILEANSNIIIQGTADKTFTNGIIGTANIDASSTTGNIIINGTTAVLGGGTLTLPSSPKYLQIGNGTIATMTSSKIITGDVSFSGIGYIVLDNFDLTVSGTIFNYGSSAYIKTNGSGYLKMNAVGGLRVFPVGVTDLNAVYINIGGNSDYSVRVENGINPAIAFPTYGINRTWNIFASANTPGVEVTFWYYTADANAGVLPQPQAMEILRYSGSAWSITTGNTSIAPAGGNPFTVTTPLAG